MRGVGLNFARRSKIRTVIEGFGQNWPNFSYFERHSHSADEVKCRLERLRAIWHIIYAQIVQLNGVFLFCIRYSVIKRETKLLDAVIA